MGWTGQLGNYAAKDNIVSELEALSAKRLTHALHCNGCRIVTYDYNPARSSSEAIHRVHANDIVLEANFWKRAAGNEPWATVLPQIISDVHHILGHTMTVRNPRVTHDIETSGIDYIDHHSAATLSPTEFLSYFGKASLSKARGTPGINTDRNHTQPHQCKGQCRKEICGLL